MSASEQFGRDAAQASPLRRLGANLSLWFGPLMRPRRTQRHWRPVRHLRRSLVVGAAVTIAVVGAVMLLVDAWAIGHQPQFPRWLVHLSEIVTDFGRSGWYLIPSGLICLALATLASPALGRMGYYVLAAIAVRAGFVFVAVGLPSLFVTIAKRIIGRARPVHFDGTAPLDFSPFAWRPDFASFPSGHGTSAFAAAVAIGALFPRLRSLMWVLAAIIALSRIAVAAHYPSDAIAGALIGACGAFWVRAWFAGRRLGFRVSRDGSIHPLPGPSLRRVKRVARRLAGQ